MHRRSELRAVRDAHDDRPARQRAEVDPDRARRSRAAHSGRLEPQHVPRARGQLRAERGRPRGVAPVPADGRRRDRAARGCSVASRSSSVSTMCSATCDAVEVAQDGLERQCRSVRLTANSVSAPPPRRGPPSPRARRPRPRRRPHRSAPSGSTPQHGPAPEARGVHEREEARLPPGGAAVERAHRRDDVDELREAADAHPVGVAQQGDQQAADDERVGDRLVVLGQRRRVLEGAGDVGVVRVGPLVPDVPLVDAQADPLAAALAPGHRVGGRDDRADHAVEVERARQVGVEVRRSRPGRSRCAARRSRRRPRRGRAPCPPSAPKVGIAGVRAADDAQLDRRDRPGASPCRPRRRSGRTRRRSSGRSATGRPSRCPGTTASRRTARGGRSPRASRRSGCRPARCSTRRGRAPRRRRGCRG